MHQWRRIKALIRSLVAPWNPTTPTGKACWQWNNAPAAMELLQGTGCASFSFFEGRLVMKKLLAATFLTAAIMMLAQGNTSTFAQAKKAKASTKTGTIELIESKDGKYRFSVRDAEGKYLGGSAVGHATEKEARAAAEDLKSVLATAVYVSKKSDEAAKEDEPKKTKAK